MRRRIIWNLGDSPPLYGHLVAAVQGSGYLHIVVGFPVSAAEVAFAKNYYGVPGPAPYPYSFDNSPEAYVDSVDDEGFTVAYNNIPDTLDINYYAS
jgi:hypothetical protein